MSEKIGQAQFNSLLGLHIRRMHFVEHYLGEPLPNQYQLEAVEASEDIHVAFNRARHVGHSLEASIAILLSYTRDSPTNRTVALQDLGTAARLPDFWKACESHGALLEKIDQTNKASDRSKFTLSLPDPEQAFAAGFILESLAAAGGSAEAHNSILRENADEIARLSKVEGFPTAEFQRLIGRCRLPKQQLDFFLPRSRESILRASPTDRGRACWISHHLWTVEATIRCKLLSTNEKESALKNLSKLTQSSRDGLFAAPSPELEAFDPVNYRFFTAEGRFSPRIDLLRMH